MARTVIWHCSECRTAFDDREAARRCCDGNGDDPDDAYGLPYDHCDGVSGVKAQP